MPKLNRTNSNTTTLAAKQTTFAIGDVVLCPSLSMESFTLAADPYGKRDDLTIDYDGSYHYYDAQGYFVSFKDTETNRYQTSLFHDTPANRQAVATLYGSNHTAPSNTLKTIDMTTIDNDEAVLMPSMMLSNIACDIEGAAGIFDDIGRLLWLIYQEKIDHSAAMALARLAHDSATLWTDVLSNQLATINGPLEQSKFGKVGA